MMPRIDYQPSDHEDRIQRLEDGRIGAAGQLAANTVMVSALTDRLTEGLEHLGQQVTTGMSQIGRDVHQLREAVQALQVMTTEDRSQIQRWKSVIRWGAGIAAAVAAGALLTGLHLR